MKTRVHDHSTRNLYPWNIQALVNWLKREFGDGSKRTLETHLKVPGYVIQSWFTSPMPLITLSHIRLIAQYRGWSLKETLDWLEIRPAHLQELIEQEIDLK